MLYARICGGDGDGEYDDDDDDDGDGAEGDDGDDGDDDDGIVFFTIVLLSSWSSAPPSPSTIYPQHFRIKHVQHLHVQRLHQPAAASASGCISPCTLYTGFSTSW